MNTVEMAAAMTGPGDAGMSPAKEEAREQVLAGIRDLHQQAGGLSRIHRTHPALYAQARRAFGSWRAAVAAAGIDYGHELNQSLRRGLLIRDQRRVLWSALSRFLAENPNTDDDVLAHARPELARRVRRCWGGVDAALAWADRARRNNPARSTAPEPAHATSET